jgi:hypothetical protein
MKTGGRNMNSINDQNKKIIRKFFDEHLIPISGNMKSANQTYFRLKPDNQVESYYIERKKKEYSSGDFEISDKLGLQELERILTVFWRGEDDKKLAEIAPDIAKMAKKLYQEEQLDEDVSPFMYVMF